MKEQNLPKLAAKAMLFCCMTWSTACINQIADDEIETGSVPITFSVKRGIAVATRITGTAFETGDQVGLFAGISDADDSDPLYIDNLCLEVGEDKQLIPEEWVYYPEGGYALDFISYYPYNPKGAQAGILPVSVQTAQNDAVRYQQSDLLVARKEGVKSSSKPVELSYGHKFAKIKITLVPGEGEKADDIQKSNPRVVATGLYTKADYDFKEDAFSNLSARKDIVAHGSWEVTGASVTGKEIILIPQEIGEFESNFTVELNGKVYTYSFPNLQLAGGTEREIKITIQQDASGILTGIAGEVSSWQTESGSQIEGSKDADAIHISALSFAQSNVYRVYHNGQPLAEICKEFLYSDEIASQAIVVYPVLGTKESDLSKGTIIASLDGNEAICGGEISWDTSTNSFSYKKGGGVEANRFFLTADKKVLWERTDEAVDVDIASYTLQDLRGGTVTEYPMVKIGTQYWMRVELQATAYRNGKKLTKRTRLNEGAGYYKPEKYNVYFYNGEALLEGELAPAGWKIPSTADWKLLETYLKGEAALLKVFKWETTKEELEVAPCNNRSMFGSYAVGTWHEGEHILLYKMSKYWSWDATTQTIPEQTVCFLGENNEFLWKSTKIDSGEYYRAHSIRCIKE